MRILCAEPPGGRQVYRAGAMTCQASGSRSR